MTVPGVSDFYGDVRIGSPLIVVGGFNRDLGFATTNSSNGDLTGNLRARLRPGGPDGICSMALTAVTRESFTVGSSTASGWPRTRDFRPCASAAVHRVGKIYVARTAGDGEFRAGEGI